ncbi:MAG: hypothetical protein IJ493_11350 [Clostridia bacterium]|nr:hypothetical protein [Clostridia bacterium]
MLCTDELLPVRPFTVKLAAAKPSQVIRLGGRDRADEAVPFTYEDGRVCFTVNELVMFDMYRVITNDTVS